MYYKNYTIALAALLAPSLVFSACDDIKVQSSGDLQAANACTQVSSLYISGDLDKVDMPNLQLIMSKLTVTGTSTLTSVSFSKLESAQSIEFTNNSGLKTISIPSLGKLGGDLFVSGNSPDVSFSAPKLQSVSGKLTFSNATVISIEALSQISDSGSFTGNSASNISLPVLKTASKSLSFSSNDKVKSIVLPNLETVGGALLIANNTNLQSFDAEKLVTIGGALQASGKFSELKVPALSEIKGGAKVESGDSSFKCDSLSSLQVAVQGEYDCKSGSSDAMPKNSTNSTSNGTANNRSSNSNISHSRKFINGILALFLWHLFF